MSELQPGALLQGGKYRIEKALGQGGFGITYLANQTNLGRMVCIKEFFMKEYGERTAAPAADDAATVIADDATVLTGVSAVTSAAAEIMGKYREKFVKEARTIARLDHPGIVRIHDVFEENGTAYYVMDFIEGENLNDLVKTGGSLSEERALCYIRQVADALSYVHGRNIMHLDVKPANIIVRKSDDRAILIDFGTAKQYDTDGTQTSTTPIGLSAGYAPIELMKIGGVNTFSPETDVYSLGATLYYLVTGQNPPEASVRMEMLMEGDKLEFPEHVSGSTIVAIETAMQSRKQRPHSILDFLQMLSESTEIPSGANRRKEEMPKPNEIIQKAPKAEQKKGVDLIEEARLQLFSALESANTPGEQFGLLSDILRMGIAGVENGHEFVDLGLPSGTKWALFNIGAPVPLDLGDFFGWGETSTKRYYDYDNYIFYKKKLFGGYSMKEYDYDNAILSMKDDAARCIWGGKWRIPTSQDFNELIKNTTQKRYKKVAGGLWLLTSRINGVSIIFPTTGFKKVYSWEQESDGYYWCSDGGAFVVFDEQMDIPAYELRYDARRRALRDASAFFDVSCGLNIRPIFL